MEKILAELESLKNSSSNEKLLDPTYNRIMETLRGKPKNCVTLALQVLSWLVMAKWTLTVDEIRIAVSVEPDRYELDDLDLPDIVTLLDVCAGLVTINEDTNTIRLAHYTIQEYLLNTSVIPGDAGLKVATACITYLSFDIFS